MTFEGANESGIGEIKQISADFGFKAPYDPKGRLFNLNYAGGSLLDIGIYPIMFSYVFCGMPDEISAYSEIGKTGVDENTVIIMKSRNILSLLSSSINSDTPQEASIYGENGFIKVHTPWWRTRAFTVFSKDKKQTFKIRMNGNGYQYEADHVSECILKNRMESPLHTHKDTLAICTILDTVRKKIKLKYAVFIMAIILFSINSLFIS